METGSTTDSSELLRKFRDDEAAKRERFYAFCRRIKILERSCPHVRRDDELYLELEKLEVQSNEALEAWHLAEKRREKFEIEVLVS